MPVFITYLLTFIMLIWGSLLSKSGQALTCPSWPMCHSVRNEISHSFVYLHRGMGFLLGVFIISLAYRFYKKSEKTALKTTLIILGFFILQGLLGGITAALKLPTAVSSFHLIFSIVCLILLLYLYHNPSTQRKELEKLDFSFSPPIKDFLFLILFVYCFQMLMGALVRHTGSSGTCGLGDPEMFLCLEKGSTEPVFFPLTSSGAIHMVHRVLGSLLAPLLIIFLGFFYVKQVKPIGKSSRVLAEKLTYYLIALGILVILQVYTGIFNISSSLNVSSTTIHLLLSSISISLLFRIWFFIKDVEFVVFKGKVSHTFLSDLFELAKPRLASLVMFTAFIGFALAPGKILFGNVIYGMIFIFLVVASATTLNCYMEVEVDKLMDRTKDRALPSGRLSKKVALIQGLFLFFVSIPLIFYHINLVTTVLALIAVFFYLAVYTPMKSRSPFAVFWGAIPGAIPPVMGYTALIGKMDEVAWSVFAILFIWQIPHFLAISIYRQEDYEKANLLVYPTTIGTPKTFTRIFVYTLATYAVSLIPYYVEAATFAYLVSAHLLGIGFTLCAIAWFWKLDEKKWARRYFLASIIYLPLLLAAFIFFRN